MKLHLGCGERYLEGYVNIDFPPSEHTVQSKSVADRHVDILALQYSPGMIDEIRLHHVFEHFTRPVACALVAGWNMWLKPGGILHIEVPDLDRTARVMTNRFKPMKNRLLAERHIFGSHEASWAAHLEGYTPDSLTFFLKNFGFKAINIKKNRWKGTYNFELRLRKLEKNIKKDDLEKASRDFLSNFLVDDTPGEKKLLDVWMDSYREQFDKMVRT